MDYYVDDLLKAHQEKLGLELIAGKNGVKRQIPIPEVHRPGLSLTGFLKYPAVKRILVFGRVEIEYLHDLQSSERMSRLQAVLTDKTPAVIVCRERRPLVELIDLCDAKEIPLFRTHLATMNLINKLTLLLDEEFAPNIHCQGTLVEVFGIGVLIQGDAAVGKSEAALGLIERGHRLIADDLIRVKKREGYLEGYCYDVSRHHLEIRGVGIINVAQLFGVVCVREKKSIDLVVKLEVWDTLRPIHDCDQKNVTILGLEVPYHVLPVGPGRDVVLLLETLALDHRLKQMGYHSAKEFKTRLQTEINRKMEREREALS